jgi:stage II sporulation protein D (peptidoglycan lytic transglycosylase)
MNSAEQRSAWFFLGVLLVALWLLSWLTSDHALDAASAKHPLNPPIQVFLRDLELEEKLEIDVEGIWELRTPNGDFLARGVGMRGWLDYRNGEIWVAGWKSSVAHCVLRSFGDAALTLDTRRYRGQLHLRKIRATKERPDHLELTLELPLEDYVLGVLTGEMSTGPSGTQAAFQAQAIAARTYAIFQLQSGRMVLSSSASDQRFLSVDYETAAAREAVHQTTGLVLKFDGEVTPAFFHADCGGQTSSGSDAQFGTNPTLRGIADLGAAEHLAQTRHWRERIDPERLDYLANRYGLGDHATGLQILQRDPGGRVQTAKIIGPEGGKELAGEELRRQFALPSAMIDLLGVLTDGSLVIEGRGRGHGVGLCQIGAQSMARSGYNFRQILAHYYYQAEAELLTEPIQP